MPVPVEIDVRADRHPAPIEATAYFVVAEALTNVAKHANAATAAVAARVEDGTLRVEVRDDGVGGARPDGSGLQGLRDRLAALDGRLRSRAPPPAARWSRPPSRSLDYSYWSASSTRRRAARRAGRIAATMPAMMDTITNVISAPDGMANCRSYSASACVDQQREEDPERQSRARRRSAP